MMRRGKEADVPRRPETPWLAGAVIGIAISTLATGAMLLGPDWRSGSGHTW
jgi:hypothetical protein